MILYEQIFYEKCSNTFPSHCISIYKQGKSWFCCNKLTVLLQYWIYRLSIIKLHLLQEEERNGDRNFYQEMIKVFFYFVLSS